MGADLDSPRLSLWCWLILPFITGMFPSPLAHVAAAHWQQLLMLRQLIVGSLSWYLTLFFNSLFPLHCYFYLGLYSETWSLFPRFRKYKNYTNVDFLSVPRTSTVPRTSLFVWTLLFKEIISYPLMELFELYRVQPLSPTFLFKCVSTGAIC